jgi:hypothetical protein
MVGLIPGKSNIWTGYGGFDFWNFIYMERTWWVWFLEFPLYLTDMVGWFLEFSLYLMDMVTVVPGISSIWNGYGDCAPAAGGSRHAHLPPH